MHEPSELHLKRLFGFTLFRHVRGQERRSVNTTVYYVTKADQEKYQNNNLTKFNAKKHLKRIFPKHILASKYM